MTEPMRTTEGRRSSMLCLGLPEWRIPEEHPLRVVNALVAEVLEEMAPALSVPVQVAISPERLLKSMLLMALYSVRSERLFCEMLHYNLLFRWFLDMSVGEVGFDPAGFADDCERLLQGGAARPCFRAIVERARDAGLLSQDSFSVDPTLIERWGGPQPLRPTEAPPARPRDNAIELAEDRVVDIDAVGRTRVYELYRMRKRPDGSEPAAPPAGSTPAGDRTTLAPGGGVAPEHVLAAARYLLEHSMELLRMSDSADIMRAIDAIPEAQRSAELRIARARVWTDMLALNTAYDELGRLVAEGAQPERDRDLLLAEVANRTGHFDVAALAVHRVLDDPQASATERVRAATSYTLLLTYIGRGDEARRMNKRTAAEALLQEHAALLAAYRAFSHWVDERDNEAADCLAYARALFDQRIRADRGSFLGAVVFACVLGRLGEMEQAERLHRLVDSLAAPDTTPLLRTEAQAARALTRSEAGERIAALSELQACAAAMMHSGYVVGALGLNAWIGRILLTLGRRDEGLQLLAETEADARRIGAFGLVHLVERSRRHDPLVQLVRPPAPPRSELKRGEVARDRALRALRAAAAGDPQPARFLDGTPALVDHALDRAMARLARAIAAQLHGCVAEARVELAAAKAEAARGNVDAELLPLLARALGQYRVVTPASQRLEVEVPSDLDQQYAIVIDGRAQEVRAGGQAISVRRRPVLRRLLFALAGCPGRALPKEALVPLVWDAEYNPLRHDGPIKSNVNELRRLIAPLRLAIEFDRGYRLDLRDSFIFVEPFTVF